MIIKAPNTFCFALSALFESGVEQQTVTIVETFARNMLSQNIFWPTNQCFLFSVRCKFSNFIKIIMKVVLIDTEDQVLFFYNKNHSSLAFRALPLYPVQSCYFEPSYFKFPIISDNLFQSSRNCDNEKLFIYLELLLSRTKLPGPFVF